MEAVAVWNNKMSFTATAGTGHAVQMDSSVENGGEDKAPRPKELILIGLAGCTGMDVVAILRKMRIEPAGFRVEVNGDQTTEHPMIFKNIHIKYYFSKNLDHDKTQRAVELSQNKYCGVSEILRKSAEISFEIIYE